MVPTETTLGAAPRDSLDSFLEELTREILPADVERIGSLVQGVVGARYQIGPFLGAGGMGVVFRAFDPSLNRHVALKFLRKDSPATAERFLGEARAQAKIEHAHVGRVYEVGEIAGVPYIALQYIQGKTLLELHAQMTLEEKVMVLRQVAEAVAAAHRTGLVHRDLKPLNILVERTALGRLHPYVMDFGLARDLDLPGATATGSLMGTPHYMSPEQAKGDRAAIDRRTDVYSLGATFYELLVGEPPFRGATTEVIVQILSAEPVAPRQRNARIPIDLETIAMRCLEKLPQDRYDSARALAEDLQRYLDGEPIAARRLGRLARFGRALRKNKALATVAALSLVAVLVAGGIALRTSLLSRERAAVAQRFGERARAIENLLRTAYLLPLHDVRREKALVRTWMGEITAAMAEGGSIAEGPGRYALGRGALALEDAATARTELERAWELGVRAPELAAALGQALGALYEQRLEAADRIPLESLREARRREARAELRDPALAYLRLAERARTEAPAYGEALIAFYENRTDLALAATERALQQSPSAYEALRLRGEISLRRAGGLTEKGDARMALEALRQARTAFAAAAEIARSDPSLHEGACRTGMVELEIAFAHGLPFDEHVPATLAGCDRARDADPDRWQPYFNKARVYLLTSARALARGGDPRPAIAAAIDLTAEVLKRQPTQEEAISNLGVAYLRTAEVESREGRDPRPALEKAVRAYERVIALNPRSAILYNNLAYTHYLWSREEAKRGLDASASTERATARYRQAVALDPTYAAAFNNMGNNFLAQSEDAQATGADPRPALEQAEKAYAEALRIKPKFAFAGNGLGIVFMYRAMYQTSHGIDPRAAIARALALFAESRAANPESAHAYANAAGLYEVQARFELQTGADPRAAIAAGVRMGKEGLRRDPKNEDARNHLGNLERRLAEHALGSGGDPFPPLRRAQDTFARSLRENPRSVDAAVGAAKTRLVHARALHARGGNGLAELRAAEEILRRAEKVNARRADLYEALARRHLLEAEWQPAQARGPGVEAGLNAVSAAQRIDPQSATALALQGALQALVSRWAGAAASFAKAFALNRHLEREYGRFALEIKRREHAR